MRRVGSPQNMVGGLLLIALAIFAFWQIGDLAVGRAMKMGPGYFPSLLAGGIALCGLILVVTSIRRPGEPLEPWPLKRIVPVLLALVVFAVTIRPLGMVAAGLLLTLLSTLGATDRKWRESAIFAVCIVAVSAVLFPTLLGLPLPIWPEFLR